MKVDFIDIILFVLFFQILSIVPYLILNKSEKKYSNYILAAFLLAKAFCISNFITHRLFDTFYNIAPHLFYIGSSFTILWGPLLYLYTRSLAYSNFKFKRSTFLHFVPFVVHFIFMSVMFHLNSADIKREILTTPNYFSDGYKSLYLSYINLSTLFYIAWSFKVLFEYKKVIKNNFSSDSKRNLSWMTFILVGFTLKVLADTFFFIDSFILKNDGYITLLISRLTLFFFVNIIIYKGLKHKNIYEGVINDSDSSKKLSLSVEAKNKYLQTLTTYMKDKKPYLNPDLTLSQLSAQVKIPQRSLSEVLNQGLGQNFYEFVNQYRVKESTSLLSNSSYQNKNILEILYNSGFNSKSSFNKSFKKFTGVTPAAYRELYKNQKESYQYN